MKRTFTYQVVILVAFIFTLSDRVNAQNWTEISPAIQDDYVYTLTTYNNDLYTAGLFDSTRYWGAAPTVFSKRIAKWDGTSWNSLGQGIKSPSMYMGVYATVVYNNELYAAGDIDSAGTLNISNNIARWNGANWDSVGSGSVYIGSLSALCVYNGSLYVGGGYGLNKWDGASWTNILPNNNAHSVSYMAVYNNELYVGGVTSVGGNSYNKLAKFNGTNWSDVGGGVKNMSGSVNTAFVASMAVFNSELYVGGDIDSAGTANVRNLARWNGTSWNDVGGGANSRVAALLAHGSTLYVSGAFWKVGSADISSNRSASWNGTTWTAMNGMLGGAALAVRDNILYGLASNHVQKWTGSLSSIDPNKISIADMRAIPNPSNGAFQIDLRDTKVLSIKIYDLFGNIVYNTSNVVGNISVDLTLVSSGIYLIKSESDEGVSVQKILIQK